MSYELRIKEYPAYVHALGAGPRTPENALRFLREAYQACVRANRHSVLLEMEFEGEAIDIGAIFAVISQRAADGMKLDKVAYVDREPRKALFAETVARNRGVNVRFFHDVPTAQRWLSETEVA